MLMICPRCASNQSDDIKFCTTCGANLQAVRDALSGKAELEHHVDATPQVKRYNEIKAGVIVSSVGFALMVFLHIMMDAIAGHAPARNAEILRSIWVAGLIPFMVGMALIINGVVVSKKMIAVLEGEQNRRKDLEEGPSPRGLRAPDTSEFIPANFSVTDQTTRHLE